MHETVSIAKAIADRNRIRVLAVLMKHEELCVCQITALLNLATPTVSRHMSILRGAGLVHSRKRGRWVHYQLSLEFPPLLRQWLVESLSGSPETEADLASLQRVLACDPGEICRCQRTRSVASNGRVAT
ncbi:MAG: helix-turn-helix transcriptional regulator [Dehalococcoidia bacterium]|jgi:ArsR family transcriptional regulator|nr:helix-turn-helix transcriptional regulator [Dehalococcoidia bacterium]